MDRREFLKILSGGLVGAMVGCGGGGAGANLPATPPTTPPNPPTSKSVKFGLGADPERMIDAYDPDGKRVLNTLKPDIVCMWINGGRDIWGRLYTPSMDYIRDWALKGRFYEWSQKGYELMIITWENYDGQNPSLGIPTYGDWHISDLFLSDLERTLRYLREQFKSKLYFALATEQSTYTACRYDRTCSNPLAYSDRINSITEEYYSKLREKLIEAIRLVKSYFPSAHVGMCFGGWLVEFEEGINFIRYFEPAIREGSAIFFQSMMEQKASETGGYGNPERILKNAKFFSSYSKPLHLAHYMPNNKRADVVSDDAERMSNPEYLRELARYLSSFCFMDYSVLKNNEFNCLTNVAKLRERLKSIPM
ncbi:MAG: hypothetical protein KNN13_09885 [Hydrogenobacter thermophilus]|uniref:hypothetical protein n=1 Tax=Hydrogenobacter thermophilus TaxID=940 RepID=UPI001C7408E6|nr:hypothetical protein [Hydrogenobacter thermophilus]QWK19761.1 MAG: hypothetical protein KNN13_09885 [Hydrogenobacter thermophilus]